MDIDYFFPWVNPLDPFWQKQHNEYSSEPFNSSRFRDWGLLKYVFRSLAVNMPWLHKVYMIVSSMSQVPLWINTHEVGIITHSQYIPPKYLPTFNSNTIEMFYYNLPWLSEHVIYGNDDFFAMAPSLPSDFFTRDGKPKMAISERTRVNSLFLSTVKRTWDMVKKNGDSDKYKYSLSSPQMILDPKAFVKPCHISTPLLKSTLEEVYKRNEQSILKSITRFRDNNRNVNQYMYADWQIIHGEGERVEFKSIGKYTGFMDNSPMEIRYMILHPKNEYKWLCINDTDTYNARGVKIIQQSMSERFPFKCKYELS